MATKLPSELRPGEHWVLFLTFWLFINIHCVSSTNLSSALHSFSSWAVCLFMLLSYKSSSLYSRHKPHINSWFEQFLPFYKFLASIIWIKKFKVGSRLFGRLAFCLFVFSFWDRVSYSPDWPRTQYTVKAGFKVPSAYLHLPESGTKAGSLHPGRF